MSVFTGVARLLAGGVLILGLASGMTACGGGGAAAGTPVLGGGGGGGSGSSQLADLSVVLNKTSVPNNGTETVTVTVTALGAGNVALIGSETPISFTVDSAVVTPAGTATDKTSGKLTATVDIGANHTSRSVSLTVSSGSISKVVSFDVVEAVAVIPKATSLTLLLSKTSIGNSGSEAVDLTVTAVDAARNVVSGIDVNFSVDNNAVLVPVNKVTDTNGQARASVLIGADKTNRQITVSVASGTLKAAGAFKVVGTKLQASVLPATLNAGAQGKIEYTLTDINSNPMSGIPVSVSGQTCDTSAGNITDATGKWNCVYTASGSGKTTITASAGGTSAESTVQINAGVPIVSTPIASATFTASPLVVSVNSVGSTANRSELRLLFRGAKSEPIPNVRVRIGVGANNSGTDGVISSGGDIVYSDANGVAVASFIAGQRPSATDQVIVYACFGNDDNVKPVETCDASDLRSVSLTVVEQPVSISIGFNAEIKTGANNLTYIHDFTVLVVDASGKPKPDVEVVPVIDLPTYRKGSWKWDGVMWRQFITAICINEDNAPGIGFRNGTIETGEDINGNGQLDPRKSDVSVSLVGSTKTDANGLAVLRIEYPQNYGSWAEFSIKVSASGVLSPPAWLGRLAQEGSTVENLTGTEQVLRVPFDLIKNEPEPPFVVSPYGIQSSCQNPN